MIAAAQALPAHSLAAFPVALDCRRPLTAHGYQDASATVEGIEALWRGRPEANIAVATGRASGAFVLDVDRHVGGADGIATLAGLETAHGPLPATGVTATPSGGRHIWFALPVARSLRNRIMAPGVEVKADGGCVCVPPSRRAGTKTDGPYQWLIAPWDRPLADAPGWLLDLADPPPVPRPPRQPIRAGCLDRLARYAAAAINSECGELAATKAGGRNHRLFQAAARLGELVGAGLVGEAVAIDALESAAHDCGLVADDGRQSVLASIKSGLRRGMVNPREVVA